jgi:hypothetical protein
LSIKRRIIAAAAPEASQYKRSQPEDYDMPLRWTALLLLLAIAPHSDAKPDCDKLACDEVKQAIREIESRMRAGYSRSQGERFDARLRKLKRKRSKLCR